MAQKHTDPDPQHTDLDPQYWIMVYGKSPPHRDRLGILSANKGLGLDSPYIENNKQGTYVMEFTIIVTIFI